MTDRRHLPLLAALALVTTGLVLAPAPGSQAAAAAAKAPMCQGKRATAVGKPGKSLNGTARADVLITNGAKNVYGRGGNDRICVTGGGSTDRVYAYGDDGNDSIVVKTDTSVYFSLGKGADRYVGGPGVDFMRSVEHDRDRDNIKTRGGDDQVLVSGNDSKKLDLVDTGDGDDRIGFQGVPDQPRTTTGTLKAGAGTDQIVFVIDDFDDEADNDNEVAETIPLALDNTDASRGTAASGAAQVARWSDVEDFVVDRGLGGPNAKTFDSAAVVFRGGPAAERFSGVHYASLDLDMGAGDDAVDVVTVNRRYVQVDGGAGTDALRLDVDNRLFEDDQLLGSTDVDLTAGAAKIGVVRDAARWSGVETFDFVGAELLGEYLQIVGSDGPDVVTASGCDVRIDGGAGADVLTARKAECVDDTGFPDGPEIGSVAFDGGAGDDTLVGSTGDDTLVGGADTDSADGAAGTDACDAETTVRCES